MKYTENMPDRLHELNGSNFEIAKGDEDITGWPVKDAQGNKVGKADDLIFDKESMKVRYMVLKVKKNKDIGLDENRKVLIPIGMAELNKDDDEVILPNITTDQLRSLPDYDKDNLSRDLETNVYNTVTGGAMVAADTDFYSNDIYNDRNLNRNRQNRTDETTNYENRQNRDRNENNEETTIPVIKEHLEVGKKEEERGGIRIHKRVVEKPVEENINLREEHVKVERKNVDRPATGRDFDNAGDEDFEMREHAEVPVVNKEARVVEEIKVRKDVTNRDEKVKDTVRNTEVDVEELAGRRS